MEAGEDKYKKILKALRSSKPELGNTDLLEQRILNAIRSSGNRGEKGPGIFDFLFGWAYIGWVRTALIGVSVFLVGLFIYQQSLILRRLDALESRTITSSGQFVKMPYEGSFSKFKILGVKSGLIPVSEKQVDEMIKSYNELENKYKDLMKVIENDPEIKKMIEDKLSERSKRKFNL